MFNGVFNFNFLALLLSEILGGSQIYTGGGLTPPGRPLSEKFFLPKASTLQYLIVFLILTFWLQQFPRFQGSQIYVRGFCAPLYAPQRKISLTRGEYVTMSNAVFNFNFLPLLLSEILGGVPNLHQGGLRSPEAPSGKILTCAQVLAYIYIIVNFQLRSCIHGGLTERSLYNRFALKNLPKWGFWGILLGGAKIFGGTPLGMQ